MPDPEVSCVILAGGKATRLGGVAKHALVIDGRTILERQRAILAPRVAEIIASSSTPLPELRTVADDPAHTGPLAGIAAGLAAATTPWVLVVAGDMPDLSGAVVDLVLAARAEARDAVGIRIGELPEPLLCLLRVATAAPVLATLLAARRYRASGLLAALAVTWIEEPALRAVDPALASLRNVNSPADLAPHGELS